MPTTRANFSCSPQLTDDQIRTIVSEHLIENDVQISRSPYRVKIQAVIDSENVKAIADKLRGEVSPAPEPVPEPVPETVVETSTEEE